MMGRVMEKGVDGVAEGAMVGEAVSEAVVVAAAAFAEGEEEADGDFEGTNFIIHSVALVGGASKSTWHVLLMPMEYPMYEPAQC